MFCDIYIYIYIYLRDEAISVEFLELVGLAHRLCGGPSPWLPYSTLSAYSAK